MNRRIFLGLSGVVTTFFAMGARVVPAKPTTTAPSGGGQEATFMIGGSLCAVVWRDPPACQPAWTMSSKDGGVQWFDDGPLTEEGRIMLVDHFGLELIAGRLPRDVIETCSPRQLVQLRRQLEAGGGLTHREVARSPLLGRHLLAEQCI